MQGKLKGTNIATSDYILSKLYAGKENARKAKELHEIYQINEQGELGFELFFRALRLGVEEARRRGYKIIGDNDGFYLAKTEEEWQNYLVRVKNRISSELLTIAACEGKSVWQMIKYLFGEKKTEIIKERQLTILFGEQ